MSREGVMPIDCPIAVIAPHPFLLTWAPLPPEEQVRLVLSGEVVGHKLPVVDLLVQLGFAASRTQAKALIKQGGVRVGPERATVKDVDDFVVILSNP
jgi:hypothetical protein